MQDKLNITYSSIFEAQNARKDYNSLMQGNKEDLTTFLTKYYDLTSYASIDYNTTDLQYKLNWSYKALIKGDSGLLFY